MKNKKLKAAVIGLGQIGFAIKFDKLRSRIWAHSEAYDKHEETDLVAGCDISKRARELFCHTYSNVEVFADYKDMFIKNEIEIISICLHADKCVPIIKDIIKNYPSVKYIFCEKPVSRSSSEINSLIDLTKNNDVKIAVNYFRKWQDGYKVCQSLIENKDYGNIQSITGYGSTALRTSTSHLLDVLISLSPGISQLTAYKQDSYTRIVDGIPDHGYYAFMKTKKDSVVFLKSTSKIPENFMFEVDILFDDARLVWSEGDKEIRIYEHTIKETYAGQGYSPLSKKPKKVSLKNSEIMLDAITDLLSCKSSKDLPASNLNNAKDTAKIIELIEKSSASSLTINL
ncbi:MAG: Gfo/Idh/MocA family oxidoreductase [SAR86 cluster bacterium]|nr:Gfo/Idh/MocA family oxidoreductase [SAR86 cluster bacterium]